MNQQTNLIQWNNLTDEQKAEYDFDNYTYECQCSMNDRTDWIKHSYPIIPHSQDVYRLKIEPDKWYYLESSGGTVEIIFGEKLLNDDYINVHPVIRPATADEIPKPSIEYITPTDDDAKNRPECEFSDTADFKDKCHRTLIAVLSGENGKDKYICAYSWRSSDQFKYCRMVQK